jgi:Predicted AAA-ATPase/PD-(D/E)XK nuclease superfamily
MKKLPIGIQTFSEIREEGYLYVDKTEQIFRLISTGKYFFISRPRRFGKSLTLSTIKAIYSGKRDLFRGLWIENQWDWNRVRPVLHIQFNEIGYATNGLEKALYNTLAKQAAKHGLTLSAEGYDQRFAELIEKLAEKAGKVVILIDEYDKPLIDYLEKEELPLAFAHQKILKNFYSILKSADPYIEFLLITGVSKFSKVSVFSDLNNLRDLTLSPGFGTLTGYTQTELETCFDTWLATALEQYPGKTREDLLLLIKEWYNGYTWNTIDYVYNPFSILNFFADGSFQDYWFKTGTPSFLVKKLKEQRFFQLNDLTVNKQIFESYALDNLELRSLLFQTGYLTIKAIDHRGMLTLGYPNREVEEALSSHLIGALTGRSPLDSTRPVVQLEEAFLNNQPEKVVDVINAMLKDLPSILIGQQDEHFYHALVHLHFRYLGFFIQSEVHTSDGRMDAVVHTPERIFILEFKIDQSAEQALQQIRDKGYADRFRADRKTVVEMGVNFDTKKRCVSDWKTHIFVP